MFSFTTALKRFGSLVIVGGAITAMFSCTGPEGPAGANGTNGTDGSTKCAVCHNENSDLSAKTIQWNASLHANGTAFDRNTTQCAPCHTSQGYRECAMTGLDSTSATINNPTYQTCRTCHPIHTKFDSTDFQKTYTSAFKLRSSGLDGKSGASVDMGGGNLCGKCHQARAIAPFPVLGSSDSITPPSYRWGPHHGPAANTIAGKGYFEIPGTATYSATGPHSNVTNGCVKCHMGPATGNVSGGHTFNANVAGCKPCHTITSLDYNKKQTNVKAMMVELRGLLAGKKWLDTTKSAGLFHSDLVFVKKLHTNEAGVLLNYLMLASDKSFGVHNPGYITAILTNSLEFLKK